MMANFLACWFNVVATRSRRSVFLVLALLVAISGLVLTGCTAQREPDIKPQPVVQQPAKPTPTPAPVVAVTQTQKIQELTIREERGQTILFLKFALPLTNYRHFPLPNPARIVLDIFTDAKQLGPTDTFRIDTSAVATLRVNQLEGGLRINTDIAAATIPAYSITQDNGGLRVAVGVENPSATAKKEVTLVSGGVRADIRSEDLAKTSGKAPGSDKLQNDKKEYTGQKISLEFKDADIKNVFRLLGEVSGKNIVITDDVNRKITVRLIEVPWKQAMDLIIDTNGLAMEEAGDVIRVSTATRLTKERQEQQAARIASRKAEIPQLSYLTVNYAKAKDLADKVKLLIKGGAELVPDDRSNLIVVRGSKTDMDEVVEIVTRLDVRTPQVLIESNLIETTPTFSRSLGIDMATRFNGGRVRTDSSFRAESPFDGPRATFFESATPIITPGSGFAFGYFANNIASVLTAAEAEGNVKIISRPSVVTLNNIESQIESTNILRIRTSAATVGEAGSLREIPAGIMLKVKPQVSADGFVLLEIEVESSTFDFGRTVEGIPQTVTRKAKANVLVRDGETVVIGGIMKDTASNSGTGIPYLKDIPALGWLFKRSTWRKDFEELVVFITPRIIASGSQNLPTAEQLWREQMSQTNGHVPRVYSINP
jgi:type IV pilus assembly protein PilQ